MARKDIWVKIIIFCLVGISYFVTGKIGLQFAFVHTNVTAIWAPAGIALASFLLFGYRIWPAIFLAAFFTNLTTAGSIGTSLGIAVGNTLEGLVGFYFVNRFAHGRNVFYRGQDIVIFTILAAFLSTTVSANIGVLTLIAGGLAEWSHFFSIWFTWWMGDAAGVLLVTPFILFWSARSPLYSNVHNQVEALLAFLTLFIISFLIFGGMLEGVPLFFSIPILVWIAFRFGRRESIAALALFAASAILGTLDGYGPFVRDNSNESLLLLQSFIDVMTVTILTLSIVVSERREVQRLLFEKEERFRALIEKSSEAISLTDEKGKIIYVSPSFINVLGYTPEEVIGKKGFELIHPADVARAIKVTSQIVGKHGSTSSVVIRCFHKDGSIRYVNILSTNLLNNPNVRAIVSNFHDVTELKQKEATIAQEKVEDEALLASIGDGIIATDSEGKVILVNKAFEYMLGWKKEYILNKKDEEIFSLFDEKGNETPIKDHPLKLAMARKKKIIRTHYIMRKDGSKFPAIITAAPVFQEGRVTGAIKVFHDITHEKEIDEMKNEFISLASHELRTPLSAIRGFIAMIQNGDYGPINPKLHSPLHLIGVSADRLIHIVNEMLDVSRIEAGKLTISLSDVAVQRVIAEVIAHLTPLAIKKDIKLIFKKEKEIVVQTDRDKFIEIMENLIGNALKFTQKGKVVITVEHKGDMAIVRVIDSGGGIAKKDQEKLFVKFDEIKLKQAGRTTGTGLGLYISREYAQLMGGNVWIDKSSLEEGSTFAFSAPLAHSLLAKRVKNKTIKSIK